MLLQSLSFTHLTLLVRVADPVARAFYEIECIRGQWSVRELRRQITSLLFERTGLSTDKAKLLDLTRRGAEVDSLALTIRDPYVFDFLGIKPAHVMGESKLEDALLDKVEYALAGMDNQLFVSRYQFELPKKEDLERLLEAEASRSGPIEGSGK